MLWELKTNLFVKIAGLNIGVEENPTSAKKQFLYAMSIRTTDRYTITPKNEIQVENPFLISLHPPLK